MKITKIDPFVMHVPVTSGSIADSMHEITHWGVPGVAIYTDTAHVGYGFTGTHAHLPTDRLIVQCIEQAYGPLLIGADPREVRSLWQKMAYESPIYWVGRAGITQLALAAIDIALWDLKAKAVQMPLWKLLGGSACPIEAYSTDVGWLSIPIEQMVDACLQRVEVDGYRAIKLKVGSPTLNEDLRRVEAVRKAVGDNVRIMTDANGRWYLNEALVACNGMMDFGVTWIEEPLAFDDVSGHRRLADSVAMSIALGEQLYTVESFRDFITAEAVHFVQADAVRLAGITPWWQVAELSHAHHLPVVPHVGDMGQVHLHLCIAHPACNLLEYIPWIQPAMAFPVKVIEGRYQPPDEIGAGTTLAPDALQQFGVKWS